MSTLICDVLTPEGPIYSGPADMVVAPAADGEIGILPRHAPLITALGKGTLKLKTGGTTTKWIVEGGFLEVLENKVSVLAEKAEATS
ncbi:MAG: ATP synthase F1 subunit epsilon [Planctomycetes bacterium]|nr:ATP synthase F1 subunit epsilon [Planctomycetota bacterium]